jgi:type VI secretion system protein ImpK
MGEIDDPFQPRDSVVRPRPGAGRRGAGETMIAWRPGTPQAAEAEPLPAASLEALGAGLNPLVRAASPLLLLAGRLRGTLSVPDVAGLRQHALEEISRFEDRARSYGIASEVVLAARYVLCAALDEAVLSTPWGAQSEWTGQTLLVALHREAWGGEKFFEMLDAISRNPGRHIDLMELQYLCLSLGFSGKYRVLEGGQARLAEVKRDLYGRIREHRGTSPDPALSLRWRGMEDRRNPVIRYVPWWVVAAGALAVLAVTFVVSYASLARSAAPIEAQLARVGLESFNAPVKPVAVRGPTLKQLLAGDEAGGALKVEDEGGRTVITLLGADLFASGSAQSNPAYEPLLKRVGAALEQVPGRVVVVGHTDDQPLRSLRFADNFELSRERALDVAKILQASISAPGRISWTGAGSSQPRYFPPSDPANRARNRRVEIVHIPGS